MESVTDTLNSPLSTSSVELFIGNLPTNTTENDIRKFICNNVSNIKEDSIISMSVVSKKVCSHGSVIVKCDADAVISKLNRSTMNGRRIKVALYDGTKKKKKDSSMSSKQEDEVIVPVKLHHSYSQAQIQEVEDVHVIALADPPLMYQISDDVLMEHFNQFDEHVNKVECFKCRSREFYKVRLTFSSQDHAKTAIIRINGSMLLCRHKLKLRLEQLQSTPGPRRHSLPIESCASHNESIGHHSKVSLLSSVSDVKKIPSIDEGTSSVHTDSTEQTLATIKVTNIKPQISKEALIAHFSSIGEVKHCKIYPHKERYGIVAFKCKWQAEKAVECLNGSEVVCKSIKSIIGVSLSSDGSPFTSEGSLAPAIKQSPLSRISKQGTHSKQRSRRHSSSATCKSDSGSVSEHNEPEASSNLVCKPCKSKSTKVIFQSTWYCNS